MKKTLICYLCAFSLVRIASGDTLLDFNTPGQLIGNFSTSQSGLITQSVSGGLNNSGALSLSALSFTNEIWTYNLSFSGTRTITEVSFYYKGNANLFGQLGLTSEAAPDAADGQPKSGANYLPIIFINSGDADGGTATIANYNTVGSTDFDLQVVSGGLPTSNDWYFYNLTIQYQGSSNYLVAGTLNASDDQGVLGTQLASLSTTYNNAPLASDNSVYLYFLMYDGVALDNFSTNVVPEPSTGGLLLGVGAMGMLVALRNRRRMADSAK